MEHHDYETLSKEIYKNLKKWYNVDIDIIRFLKIDPLVNNKLYLDIYPEKRKKMSNSIDAFHSKRNGWSLDYQSFSQAATPTSINVFRNSKNFEETYDLNDFYNKNSSK